MLTKSRMVRQFGSIRSQQILELKKTERQSRREQCREERKANIPPSRNARQITSPKATRSEVSERRRPNAALGRPSTRMTEAEKRRADPAAAVQPEILQHTKAARSADGHRRHAQLRRQGTRRLRPRPFNRKSCGTQRRKDRRTCLRVTPGRCAIGIRKEGRRHSQTPRLNNL